MTEPGLVGQLVAPLESLGLCYMVTGGVASVIYGDPRFIRDIDLILELGEAGAGGLLDAFSPDDSLARFVPPTSGTWKVYFSCT